MTPRILGVIGLAGGSGRPEEGDIVTAINGKEPFSRVDAFRQVQKAGRAVIDLNRDGAALQVSLEKEEGASPGFVMAADLEPALFHSFTRRMRQVVENRALVATSTLAAPILASALDRVQEELPSLEIAAVPNVTFGGNICCSGLLLLEDFLAALPDRECGRSEFYPWHSFADGRDCGAVLELQTI